jgi:3-oxoacyl-[acyl-carrier-protein] synthase-1
VSASSPRAQLAILGYGLCTPLGLDARVTSAEMAAGTAVFADTEVRDRTGEPARAARLSLIPAALSRTERMMLLARTALDDLLAHAAPAAWDDRMPIVLALPAPDEGGAAVDLGQVAALIGDLAPRATPGTSRSNRGAGVAPRSIPRGRAALFSAIAEADRLLANDNTVDSVLIGAVDSLCDRASLESFARANGILGAANPNGLIPAEAAGFVIVGRSKSRGTRGRLVAHATAEGPGRDAPPASAGQALTAVFTQLSLAAPAVAAVHVLSAQPSDRCWSRELGVAMLRAPRGLPEPFAASRITETVGDAGAAAAIVLMVFALLAPLGRPGGPALVYGSSDAGLVGGVLVEAA